jgi:hypothetical protein
MKKIALIVALALVVAIGAVLAVAATRPDRFRVERSLVINAPAGKIYPMIVDLHGWSAWSPYEKRDPAMKRTFSGTPSGLGAVYAWDGNSEIGAGRMEIIEATAPAKVRIKLDFMRPMEGHNVALFALAPRGDTTTVTWSMEGPMPFLSKVMCLFLDMDAMIGKDFAAGLAQLKANAEK